VAIQQIPAQLSALARLMGKLPAPPPATLMESDQHATAEVLELVALGRGKAAPPFDLKDLSGKPIHLDDYRGRITLVNFWATWCPPCVEEIPSMNQLARRYDEREFSVVSIDFREPEQDIREFAKEVPVEFPVLLDSDGRVSWAWKVFSFPSSFIVDRSGRIRYSANRAIDWNTPTVWAVIDTLLQEPR
jgi:peroxiredoxin